MALTSSFAVCYQNLALSGTVTATTSATGYPASNLSLPRLSASHRTTDGSLVSQNIDVDLNSSQTVDIAALIGVNHTDSAARALTLSNNSDFSSPLYSSGSGSAFDVSYPDLASVTYRYGRNLIAFPGQSYSPQYVRLALNDFGNPSNYLSSRVYWVGPVWQPQISFSMKEGSFKRRFEFVGDPGLERVISYLDVSLDALTEAEGAALRSIILERARTRRLFVIPRPDQPATWQGEALYCTLQGAPALTAWPQGGGLIYWKVQMTFKECED